jgi:hypothetical protein
VDFDNALTKINGHLFDLAHAALDRFEAQTIAAAQEALTNVDKLLADEVKSATEPVMAEALGLARAPIRELVASLTRFVAASLRGAAVFDAASLEALSDSLARYMSEAFKDTPVHDVILITSEHATDEQKLEAIHRLAASKAFSRRALFHPLRWNALSDGFGAYCAEQAMSAGQEISAAQAWGRLIEPAIVLAFAEASRKAENKPIAELWRIAHNVARREIEMAILDGMTLGCKELQNEELPLDNDDNIGVLFDLEPDSGISESEREALQKAMELIAKLLTPRELEALMDAPRDKAGMMARKRALDKIHKAGIAHW